MLCTPQEDWVRLAGYGSHVVVTVAPDVDHPRGIGQPMNGGLHLVAAPVHNQPGRNKMGCLCRRRAEDPAIHDWHVAVVHHRLVDGLTSHGTKRLRGRNLLVKVCGHGGLLLCL